MVKQSQPGYWPIPAAVAQLSVKAKASAVNASKPSTQSFVCSKIPRILTLVLQLRSALWKFPSFAVECLPELTALCALTAVTVSVAVTKEEEASSR